MPTHLRERKFTTLYNTDHSGTRNTKVVSSFLRSKKRIILLNDHIFSIKKCMRSLLQNTEQLGRQFHMIAFVRSSKDASGLRFVGLQTLQKINDISAIRCRLRCLFMDGERA